MHTLAAYVGKLWRTQRPPRPVVVVARHYRKLQQRPLRPCEDAEGTVGAQQKQELLERRIQTFCYVDEVNNV
jgi:hypothetical protein